MCAVIQQQITELSEYQVELLELQQVTQLNNSLLIFDRGKIEIGKWKLGRLNDECKASKDIFAAKMKGSVGIENFQDRSQSLRPINWCIQRNLQQVKEKLKELNGISHSDQELPRVDERFESN